VKKYLLEITLFTLLASLPLLGLEWFLRQPAGDAIAAKHALVEANLTELETLILGSSHALTGLNPEWVGGVCVNAANTNQPFYYDFQILKEYTVRSRRLQTVMLPLSYPMFFYAPDERQEHLYYLYWGLPPYSGKKDFESYSAVLALGLEAGLKRLSAKDNLFETKGWAEENTTFDGSNAMLDKRVEVMHSYMQAGHFEDNVKWLRQIIAFCQANHLRLVLYKSPSMKAFETALANDEPFRSKYDALLNSLFKDPTVEVHDFSEDTAFMDDLFRDPDHLNAKGARVLSEKMRSILAINPKTLQVKSESL
jgi:hypothetical protein